MQTLMLDHTLGPNIAPIMASDVLADHLEEISPLCGAQRGRNQSFNPWRRTFRAMFHSLKSSPSK